MSILKRLNFKAIICGFLLDLGGQIVLTATMVMGLLLWLTIQNAGQGDSYTQVSNAGQTLARWSSLPLLFFGIKSICQICGGALTARLAPQAPYLNAATMSLLAVIFSLSKMWLFPPTLSSYYVGLFLATTLPLVLMGACLQVKTRRHKSIAAPSSLSPIPDVPQSRQRL